MPCLKISRITRSRNLCRTCKSIISWKISISRIIHKLFKAYSQVYRLIKMAKKAVIAPFKEQHRLEEGLLRTLKGKHIHLQDYGRYVNDEWIKFVELAEQDQLTQGKILL